MILHLYTDQRVFNRPLPWSIISAILFSTYYLSRGKNYLSNHSFQQRRSLSVYNFIGYTCRIIFSHQNILKQKLPATKILPKLEVQKPVVITEQNQKTKQNLVHPSNTSWESVESNRNYSNCAIAKNLAEPCCCQCYKHHFATLAKLQQPKLSAPEFLKIAVQQPVHESQEEGKKKGEKLKGVLGRRLDLR